MYSVKYGCEREAGAVNSASVSKNLMRQKKRERERERERRTKGKGGLCEDL